MSNDLTAGAIQSRILQYASLRYELKTTNHQQPNRLMAMNVIVPDIIKGTMKISIKEIYGRNNLFPPIADDNFFEVETYILDEVFTVAPRVNVINLDVKGAAPLILKGMQNLLTQNPQVTIYMVFNSSHFDNNGVHPQDLIYDFLQRGFSVVKMNMNGNFSAISVSELLNGSSVNLVFTKVVQSCSKKLHELAVPQSNFSKNYASIPNDDRLIAVEINSDNGDKVSKTINGNEFVVESNIPPSLDGEFIDKDRYALALRLSGIVDTKALSQIQKNELNFKENELKKPENSDEKFLQETNNLSDEAFLQAAYRTYLKREADEFGKQSYLQYLDNDRSKRQQVLNAFQESQEFKLLNFDYSKYPQRLNLGCGFDIKPGYLNVDLHESHKPDLVADIRHLNILPSGFYEEIIAQDCLEHLPRCETELALKEWSRLLKHGGILKLRVPSVIDLLELFKAEHYQTVEGQQKLLQCLFGTQAYDGDWHFTSFTQKLLTYYLETASFAKIEFKLIDGWLFDVTAEKVG
jgi:predicted SAM-dependent methyltransferase